MTGIGHYIRELILRLPQLDRETTYVAWYLNARRALRPWRWGRRFFPRRPNLMERWTPIPATWFERTSLRRELPRLEWLTCFDVLFAPNFVPPPTRSRRLVLTVHDLAFRLYPETAPLATRRWLARLDRALDQAAEIIVPSESTRTDLLRQYALEPARITVIHHGVDHGRYRPASPQEVERVRARYRIDGPYLLFVGGIEPRKNLPGLLRAYARFPEASRPALVIAGASVAWNLEGMTALRDALDVLSSGHRAKVILTGYVHDREKVALYTGAEALVFPSRYEGFGFPVLEAMACGTPVVTSNVSSLPEVAGDAAVLVNPDDDRDLSGGIRRILEDRTLRERLREAGRARASAFTWDQAARSTAEVLHRAARR